MTPQPEDREVSGAEHAPAADRESRELEMERQTDDREVQRVREGAGPADVGMASRDAALLAPDVVEDFHSRWNDVQAGFVDEPRRAVEQADALVADAIGRLGESFANERTKLEGQWDRGDGVSTEDLRRALQRYRSFFSRLLNV